MTHGPVTPQKGSSLSHPTTYPQYQSNLPNLDPSTTVQSYGSRSQMAHKRISPPI